MPTWAYFLIWAVLIFLMMRFGCGAHVMGHGNRHGHGSGSGRDGREPPETAVDPVCGMSVAGTTAKTAVYGGAVYYFCSATCREKFEANPETYVARTERPHHAEHRHGC